MRILSLGLDIHCIYYNVNIRMHILETSIKGLHDLPQAPKLENGQVGFCMLSLPPGLGC